MKDRATLLYVKKVVTLRVSAVISRAMQQRHRYAVCLIQYVRHTWMEWRVWTPAAWSIFSLSIRTNNDAECWQRRLNCRGRPQVSFYLLVQLLYDEAKPVTVQVRLISEHKLCKHQRKVLSQMFQLWQEYEDGRTSARQLLNSCAKVYGHAV